MYMKYIQFIILILFLFFILNISLFGQVYKKFNNTAYLQNNRYTEHFHPIQQGKHMKLWLSAQGKIGKTVLYGNTEFQNEVGCEYPSNTGFEHITEGGLLIGALIDTSSDNSGILIPKVTSTFWSQSDDPEIMILGETSIDDTSKSWYYTSILNQNEPNKRGIDDDGDGLIDEDELDGIDNDGDGLIDEDYGAISESDYYCTFTDTIKIKGSQNHIPLGIKVIQKSYAWESMLNKPILPIEYSIINLGKRKLFDVYIGILIDTDVGNIFFDKGFANNNNAGYWPELMTAYVSNIIDRTATPVGITILSVPESLKQIKYIFRWLNQSSYSNDWPFEVTDSVLYNWMNGTFPNEPLIRKNQQITGNSDIFILYSFGPINNWAVGETLKLSFSIESGFSLNSGSNSLYNNASIAQTLFARGYAPPVYPPAPKLRMEPGFRSVMLNWAYTGNGVNPLEVWDDANRLIDIYPPDHWRRINPPEGHTTGGRIFEGYRLYRSEDPAGTAKSFVMLMQWDIKDSVGPKFGYDTGIETTFVDENLTTGKTYWYAVTSFGIPDVHVMDYVDWDGSVKVETLAAGSSESSVLASRKRMKLPFSVSHELGKVLVVPNPYRVDEDYTYEMGGYEGRAKVWNENKRRIKFIHLPPRCTVRIFTIAGEIVATLRHESESNGEMDWNMMSESNRTIASGLYIFTVESDYGTQTGKFVVIR